MTKNCREEYYDAEAKVSVIKVDVSDAAQALANGHLLEDIPAAYLAEGLVAAALLGAEMSEKDETVIVQMKCTGALGGYLVECTSEGTLRGYTEKKTNVKKGLGNRQYQITRSVPGRILSQGVALSLDGYLRDSLQRKARMEISGTTGILVEVMPDAGKEKFERFEKFEGKEGFEKFESEVCKKLELKKSTKLSFACRCSPDRAVAMLSAMSEEERRNLPETLDITCHMCGRTFTVKTR